MSRRHAFSLIKAGHCLSQVAWSSCLPSFLHVVHLKSDCETLHSPVGCFLVQFEQASSSLQLAAVCPAPMSWHLKQHFGSSSSFLVSCHKLSISILPMMILLATFLEFNMSIACALSWLAPHFSAILCWRLCLWAACFLLLFLC